MAGSSPNGIKSDSFSSNEKIAAVAWQTVRELFPVANNESDYAVRLRVKLMSQIIDEVGQEKFTEAVEMAISVSQRRYDVSVARIRECADLRYVPPITPVARAWQFVTQTFINHCRLSADGNYRLEDKTIWKDGVGYITPVPHIPSNIMKAIHCLGGWAALAESYPEYWTAKLRDFRDFYEEEPSPGRDLERVK